MTKVTVFVPTYNYAKYLPQCLNSILQQTRKVDEILIIDDCSQDNTQSVIKKYKHKVTFIKHPVNIGSIKTFNEGFRKAKGDYIMMLSADDWINRKTIEKEALILDSNPDVAMVYSQAFDVIKNRKKQINPMPANTKSYLWRKDEFALLLTHGDYIPYNALVRKSIYQKLGTWDCKLKFQYDWEMWVRIAKNYKIAFIAKPLLYYRIHKNNLHLNSNFQKDYEQGYLYVLKKHLPQNSPKQISPIKNEAYYNFYLSVCIRRILQRKRKEAFYNWKKAIMLKPYSLFQWRSIQPLFIALKSAFNK